MIRNNLIITHKDGIRCLTKICKKEAKYITKYKISRDPSNSSY